jgi:hypothetical protein
LKVLKVKSVLSVYAPMVFKFFWCRVMEKIEIKVFTTHPLDMNWLQYISKGEDRAFQKTLLLNFTLQRGALEIMPEGLEWSIGNR